MNEVDRQQFTLNEKRERAKARDLSDDSLNAKILQLAEEPRRFEPWTKKALLYEIVRRYREIMPQED